mgnify:CR=1 FL=1
MKGVILVLVLVGPAAAAPQPAGGATAADALVGAWTANLSKSERDANHQFAGATMRFEVDGEALLLVLTGVNAAGNVVSSTTTYYPNGREYPVEQVPGTVSITEWVGPRTLDTKAKKGDELVGHGTYEVSVDGQMLTATIRGTDARGRVFEQVVVFDRQVEE